MENTHKETEPLFYCLAPYRVNTYPIIAQHICSLLPQLLQLHSKSNSYGTETEIQDSENQISRKNQESGEGDRFWKMDTQFPERTRTSSLENSLCRMDRLFKDKSERI